MLGKRNLLYAYFHQPIRPLIHRVTRYFVFQILLHFRNIEHSSLSHFLELLIINVSTVHCYDSPPCNVAGRSMKESLVAAEVNFISEGTPSFACITVWTLMPPFFFPVLG